MSDHVLDGMGLIAIRDTQVTSLHFELMTDALPLLIKNNMPYCLMKMASNVSVFYKDKGGLVAVRGTHTHTYIDSHPTHTFHIDFPHYTCAIERQRLVD